MACAPFLALSVIKQSAAKEGSYFPLAVPFLRDCIYVDDLLFGDDDVDQLLKIRDQFQVALLRKGGFELRKWASNSPTLLADINPDDHGLACTKPLSIDKELKILGIGRNPSLDAFQVHVCPTEHLPSSKRSILSAIAKLYDPLGWVIPVTITAKTFMQQLWREKIGWDDEVPDRLLRRCHLIFSKLSCLYRIPRWVGLGADVIHAEVHGFADASNIAYAAAVYIRIVTKTGNVSVELLAGKSRVAPLTPLSVPRLEFSAAVLLTRLMNFVCASIGIEKLPRFCWTDSTVVLTWVQHHPSRWKIFAAHRVAEIQSRLPTAIWHHVSSHDNPADCASRGLLGDELLNHTLRWHGSSWLRRSQDDWPNHPLDPPTDTPLEENKIVAHVAHAVEPFDLASRYSSWPKLLRVTAYILRFASRCRRVNTESKFAPPPGLTMSAEYRLAEIYWIRQIQSKLFPQDVFELSQQRSLSVKSAILSLRPFLDNDKVLRVGERLRHAPLPLSTRHPVLLASHPLVQLIVEYFHKRALHAGIQLTLQTLREKF